MNMKADDPNRNAIERERNAAYALSDEIRANPCIKVREFVNEYLQKNVKPAVEIKSDAKSDAKPDVEDGAIQAAIMASLLSAEDEAKAKNEAKSKRSVAEIDNEISWLYAKYQNLQTDHDIIAITEQISLLTAERDEVMRSSPENKAENKAVKDSIRAAAYENVVRMVTEESLRTDDAEIKNVMHASLAENNPTTPKAKNNPTTPKAENKAENKAESRQPTPKAENKAENEVDDITEELLRLIEDVGEPQQPLTKEQIKNADIDLLHLIEDDKSPMSDDDLTRVLPNHVCGKLVEHMSNESDDKTDHSYTWICDNEGFVDKNKSFLIALFHMNQALFASMTNHSIKSIEDLLSFAKKQPDCYPGVDEPYTIEHIHALASALKVEISIYQIDKANGIPAGSMLYLNDSDDIEGGEMIVMYLASKNYYPNGTDIDRVLSYGRE